MEETFHEIAYSIEIGSAKRVSKLTNLCVKPSGIYRSQCRHCVETRHCGLMRFSEEGEALPSSSKYDVFVITSSLLHSNEPFL